MPRRLFVVSGPSGVGKSTILRQVVAADPELGFAISHTTRAPRDGEVDGRDYHFVDDATFDRMIEADGFVEFAVVHGNRYGTSRAAIESEGRGDLLIEVDVQGAEALRSLPGVITVFITPPSFDDLGARLRRRGRDEDAAIRGRLEAASGEMEQEGRYDHVVVNRELPEAVAEVAGIIAASRES